MSIANKPWLALYGADVMAELPIPVQSLSEMLREAVSKYAEDTALTFYSNTWKYKELFAITEQFASALHASGFRKGDRMAIMLPNSPHYVFALFGAFRLGGIVTQVNPMYVERELEYILNDSGAETIVVLDLLYPRVNAVRSKTNLKHVIVVSLTNSSFDLAEGDLTFEQFLLGSQGAHLPEEAVNPLEDVAVLQYTGGTTGNSKGAMLTHQNMISDLAQAHEFMKHLFIARPADAKNINILPMFHIYGLTCVTFLGIYTGINQVILPRFDVREVMEAVKREQPYLFSAVPTMYIALNSQPDLEQFGFEKVRYFNSGGAPMPIEQLHYFESRVNNKLFEGYGLSEASPVTHVNPAFLERKPGTIGIPLPNTEVRLVDPITGEDVGPGQKGELLIKGPQVMKGYWNLPDKSREALKDGWLYTGDIAEMDEQGYFSIVDRKKDMIISSGYNVYPREIEEVLYLHPGVMEAIVIGIPDGYRGESAKAFVTKKEGAEVSEEELITLCKTQLAPYKVPRAIEFRKDLPRSAVGKLLKRVLVDEEMKKAKQTDSASTAN